MAPYTPKKLSRDYRLADQSLRIAIEDDDIKLIDYFAARCKEVATAKDKYVLRRHNQRGAARERAFRLSDRVLGGLLEKNIVIKSVSDDVFTIKFLPSRFTFRPSWNRIIRVKRAELIRISGCVVRPI